MNLETINQSIAFRSQVFDKKSEYPIDCEFTLPDYCPDIERILKCTVKPLLSNLSVLTDTAQVEINACISVLYVTKEDKLFGYEMPVSISKSVNIGIIEKETIKQYKVKTEYVNCRAINNRKIDVHGSVSLGLKLCTNEEKDVITDMTDDYVVLKKQKADIMEICGFADKQINVSDDIALPSTSGSVSNLIRYDVKAIPEDCKTISNKAILKMNVVFEILYLSSDMRYEKLNHSVPVSQIIDVDGVDENSVCSIKTAVCSVTLKPLTNDEGEMRTISASAKVNVSVVSSNINKVSFATDGYSTRYESEIEKSPIEIEKHIKSVNDSLNISDNIDVSSEISQVIDFKCIPLNINYKTENNALYACGDIAVCIAMEDENNCCKYYEKVVPFSEKLKVENPDENYYCDFCVEAGECSYNITSNNSIDFKCELKLFGNITERKSFTAVVSMTVDEAKEKSSDDMPSLVVYFGTKGESVWDIALRYNTSAEKISEANNIENDYLQKNQMLLIPSM